MYNSAVRTSCVARDAAQSTQPRTSFSTQWHRPTTLAGALGLLLGVVACSLTVVYGATDPPRATIPKGPPLGVVPGEFEPQQAILLAWPQDLKAPYPQEFAEISRQESRLYCDVVRAIQNRVRVIIVTKDARTQHRVKQLLRTERVPLDSVQFVEVPVNSK